MGLGNMNIKDIIRKLHVGYLWARTREVEEFVPEGRMLIVAPHPDDEVIGCGGLIARLVAEGRAPHVIVMTGGGGSHGKDSTISKEEIVRNRRQLTRNALGILGVPEENLHELNFPDGEIPSGMENLELKIENGERLRVLLEEIGPDTVLVPHWGEGWPDHVNTAKLVREMLRELVISNEQLAISGQNVPRVWEYCVWMWYYNVWRGLDWKNARSLRLSPEELKLKREAIKAYVEPTAPDGKPWSGNLPKIFLDANRGGREIYFANGN